MIYPKIIFKNFALSLLFLAPFFDFLRFNNYSLFQPETLTIISLLCLIGFLCGKIVNRVGFVVSMILYAFWISLAFSFFPAYSTIPSLLLIFIIALLFCMLFMQHINELLSIIFLVFIAGIFLLPMQIEAAHPALKNTTVNQYKPALPPIVYIILDEHAGINAIPQDTQQGKDLKSSLIHTYADNGFELFTNAYSHYPNTYNSIPNLLNFTQSAKDNAYFDSKTERHLLQNKFFELLSKRGYQIRVYQAGDYLDYCKQKNAVFASCYSFPTLSVGMMQQTALGYKQRLMFLEKSFLLQSSFYQLMMSFYQSVLQPFLHYFHVETPYWTWNEARVSSLQMLNVFAQLRNDIQHQPGGTFFFAHIFAPHSPYAFDSDCQLLPVNQWKVGSVPMAIIKNTPDTRAAIYRTYIGQTTCVEKQIQLVFKAMRAAGIYDKAIIIVQGDHGSRIALDKPFLENKNSLTQQDFTDYYMTLFAAKIPGTQAKVDSQLTDIQTLLADVVRKIPMENITIPANSPYVYLLPSDVGLPLARMEIKDFK